MAAVALSGDAVRVGLVAPTLDIIGGQSIAATRLFERLRDEPSIVMDYIPINPRARGPFRSLQRVKFVRTIVTSIVYGWTLLRRVPRVDVLHVLSPSYWAFLLGPVPAMLAGRLFGKAVILNYHSGEARDHLTRFGWHVKPLLRLAHRIVVPSEYLVGVFAEFGIEAEAVYNFVDTESVPYRRRETLTPRVLSNRNLESHYNVGAVLDAFETVRAAEPAATLVVAGGGSQRMMLEARASAMADGAITFMGQVAPSAMPALYDAADLFVNASLIDNMPLSILEAYAAGLPVVTSDAGGIPTIAHDGITAVVIPAGDTAALAEGMLRLLREPGLARRLADAGRELVMSRYSWQGVGPRWVSLYRSLAGRTA
jgi:glycosyltransferase involved in cell wall biosynthesis